MKNRLACWLLVAAVTCLLTAGCDRSTEPHDAPSALTDRSALSIATAGIPRTPVNREAVPVDLDKLPRSVAAWVELGAEEREYRFRCVLMTGVRELTWLMKQGLVSKRGSPYGRVLQGSPQLMAIMYWLSKDPKTRMGALAHWGEYRSSASHRMAVSILRRQEDLVKGRAHRFHASEEDAAWEVRSLFGWRSRFARELGEGGAKTLNAY